MAKLFVIPASGAPVAVIFRRGPSQWYHLIRWDTRSDTFTSGAWIKGRIYEEACDLSPDGSLLLYFVHQGSRGGSDFTNAWTAVSRVPWLTALVLWPQGMTYNGGGRFIDNRTIALRGVWNPPHADFPLRGLQVVEADTPLHAKTNDVPDADWRGRDHQGRMIFSRAGQLFRRTRSIKRLVRGKLTANELVADFTDLKPTPEAAPEWATKPL